MVNFDGIQQIIYGVDDLETCRRFLIDWGLRQASESIFETLDGSQIVIAPLDTPTLPTAIEEGPTLRQLTWRLRARDDLDTLARKRLRLP